ncbi:remorin 4.1-like [Phragmites australis]|uniref:remorin 4.1-like n=1 Tax=Phragmites australis TaxID=29695 RepID=UPI002D7903BA|nr:remorin 4.1-like [Phragmites australis]
MLHEQQAPVPAPPSPVPSAPANDDAAGDDEGAATFRDIHPLTPTPTPPARSGSASWDTASHRSSSEEQFMTMSREFTAMVAAGATMQTGPNSNNSAGGGGYDNGAGADQLTSIGEDELEETNPLAIVPDSHPIATPARSSRAPLDLVVVPAPPAPVEARQVKKEEVETKVTAWQTAEMAKINNRFKREEVVINGWETEQLEKASACLKKIERKLDEQRAKALEKTQNDIAKARRKAEEKRASAEAKRGLKLAKVLELANFMKAVGRVPSKRSFF